MDIPVNLKIILYKMWKPTALAIDEEDGLFAFPYMAKALEIAH